ncbi:MAG: O-antigen ligase family protein [Chloroflexi bacterium]|nr:O-antigen ligase family protein [Chloroflexota bacterium]
MAGILAARLPVPLSGGMLMLTVLGAAILVEPVLGIILMLGVAPLKTLIDTEAPFALPIDAGQMGFGLVLGAWAIWRVLHHRGEPLPRTRVMLPLIGCMLAFSPSLYHAVSTSAWIAEFLKWVEMALLVVVVLDLGRAGRWTWIVLGAVLAAVLQALIGVYEFRGGSGAPHLWIAGYRYFRAFGTFGQPNPFSAYMGLTLPLACGMAWGHLTAAAARWLRRGDSPARMWWKPGLLAVMYGGFALVLLAGLIAAWGRGAWLGFGAASVVMVFFAPRRRWQGVLLMGCAAVLPAGLWFVGAVPATIQQRVNNAVTEFIGFRDVRGAPISNENFAIVERLAHWQAAIEMANAQPWIGVGLGNFEAVYPEYGVPSWPRPLGHAHNDYLNLLAETGLIGLLGYLISWLALGMWTVQALQQPDPIKRGLVLGLLGTWTHLAVHSFVDKLYVNNLFLHIGVMLGLLAIVYEYRQALVGNKISEYDDL